MQSLRSIAGQQLHEVVIPSIPPKINLAHLHTESTELPPLLLTLEQAAQIKSCLSHKADGRFDKYWLRKQGIDIDYAVIKQGDRFFAIYYGAKHNKQCGKGIFGTVKYLQNIDTGDWVLLKIQSAVNTPPFIKDSSSNVSARGMREAAILKKVGLFLGAYDRVSHQKGYQFSILMKWVKGVMLENLIQPGNGDRKLSDYFWLVLARNCCQALAQLHEQARVIHYDIHSENMIYNPDTRSATLIDFGMADAYNQKSEMSDVISDNYRLGEMLISLFGMADERGIIYPKNSKAFSRNSKIRNSELALEIRFFIRHHMMGDSKDRVTSLKASQFFEELLGKYKSDAHNIKLVNVGDLLNCASFTALRLTQYDRVVLIDPRGEFDIKDYIILKRRLEASDIFVASKVLVTKVVSAPDMCPQKISSQAVSTTQTGRQVCSEDYRL